MRHDQRADVRTTACLFDAAVRIGPAPLLAVHTPDPRAVARQARSATMHVVRRRVLPLAAVALSAVVGLTTACTSGHGADPSTIPAPSSTTTTPASPSPSRTGPLTTGPNVAPGEKPPTLPEDATRHTPTGALQFAYYYYDAFDWSIATNDSYLISAISLPTCQACRRFINGLADLHSKGQVLRGGRVSISSASIVTGSFNFKSDYVVKMILDEGSETLEQADGTSATVAAAAKTTSLVFVSWLTSAWKIVEVAAPS